MSNLYDELLSVHTDQPGLAWYSKDRQENRRTSSLGFLGDLGVLARLFFQMVGDAGNAFLATFRPRFLSSIARTV
jgi:hypothetical protein